MAGKQFNTGTKLVEDPQTDKNFSEATIDPIKVKKSTVNTQVTPAEEPYDPYKKPSGKFNDGTTGIADFGNTDFDEVEGISPELAGFAENFSAAGQNWWNKFGRTLSRGATKGASGAVLGTLGSLTGLVWNKGGQALLDLDEELGVAVDEALPVHEYELGENASFVDKLTRFSVLESTVDSVVEFSALGLGVSSFTKVLGSGAMKLGLATEYITGSKKAANLVDRVGQAGKYAKDNIVIGKILGKNISSKAIIDGIGMNFMEGRIMGKETEENMRNYYSSALLDPGVSPAMKEEIESNISAAGTKMQILNTALAVTDIMGMNLLTGYMKQGARPTNFFSYTLKNMKLMSVPEGLEEVVQNVMQSSSEYTSIASIEDAAIKEGILPENPFANGDISDDSFLSRYDKGKAEEIARKNSRNTASRLWEYATSDQALIEGVSGALGGGLRWSLTNSISVKKDYNAHKSKAEAEAAFVTKVEEDYMKFVGDKLLTEVRFNQLVDDMKKEFPNADETKMQNAVNEYATARTVIKAIQNDYDFAMDDLFDQTKKRLKQEKSEGTISEEDFKKSSVRIKKAEKYLAKYRKMKYLPNAKQVLDAELKVVALEALDSDMWVWNTEEFVLKNMKIGESFLNNFDDKGNEVEKKAKIEKEQITEPDKTIKATDKSEENVNAEDKAAEQDKTDEIIVEKPTTNVQVEAEPEEPSDIEIFSPTETQESVKTEKLSDTELAVARYSASNDLVDTRKNIEKLQDEVDTLLFKYRKTLDRKAKNKLYEKNQALKAAKDKEQRLAQEMTSINNQIYGEGTTMPADTKSELQIARDNLNKLKSAEGQREALKVNKDSARSLKMINGIVKSNSITNIKDLTAKFQAVIDSDTATEADKINANNLLYHTLKQKARIKLRGANSTSKVRTKKEYTKTKKTDKKDTATEVVDIDDFFENMTQNKDGQVEGETASLVEEEDTGTSEMTDMEAIFAQGEKDHENFTSGDLNNIELNEEYYGGIDELVDNMRNNQDDIINALDTVLQNKEIQDEEPTYSKGKTGNVPLIEANKKIMAFLEAVKNLRPDGTYPPMTEAIEILKRVGPIQPNQEKALSIFYSAYINEDYVSNLSSTKIEKKIFEDRYTTNDSEFEGYDATEASLDISGTAFTRVGETVKDHTIIKQGAAVNFKILNNAEIAKLEESDPNFRVYIGDDPSNITSMTFQEFLDQLKKKDNNLPSNIYNEAAVRPIAITYGDNNETIGYLHTPQWALKARKKGAKNIEARQKEVVGDILKLRTKVYTEAKNGIAKGIISERSRNIGLNNAGTYVKGTALAQSSQEDSAESVFGEDENIIYTTINGTKNNGLSSEINKMTVGKGKHVIFPDYLTGKGVNNNSGALVALIPIEDTNYYMVSKLNTTRISEDDFIMTSSMVASLDNKDIFGQLTNALGLDSSGSKILPTPKRISYMLKSILHTDKLDEDTISSSIKYSVKYSDDGDLAKSSGSKFFAFKKSNPAIGSSKTLGTITLGASLSGSDFELVYSLIAEQKKSPQGTAYTVMRYVLKSDEQTRKDMSRMLLSARQDKATYPYYDIKEKSLERHRNGLPNSVLRDTGKGYKYEEINYVSEYLEKKARTYILKQNVNTDGTVSYFKNTIINVDTVDSKSNSAPVVSSTKNSASDIKTSKALQAEKNNLENEYKSLNNEYNKTAKLKNSIKKSVKKGKISIIYFEGSEADKKELLDYKGNKTWVDTNKAIEADKQRITDRVMSIKSAVAQIDRDASSKAVKSRGTTQHIIRSIELGSSEFEDIFGDNPFNDNIDFGDVSEITNPIEEKTISEQEAINTDDNSKMIAELEKARKSLEAGAKTKVDSDITSQEADALEAEASNDTDITLEKGTVKRGISEVSELSSVRKKMSQFKLKQFLGIDKRLTTDLFSVQEQRVITKSFAGLFLQRFLAMRKDEIQAKDLSSLKNEATNDFYASLKETYEQTEKESSDDDTVNKKLVQYKEGLKLLIDTFESGGVIEDRLFLLGIINGGYSLALNSAGYTKRTEYERTGTKAKDSKDSEAVGEDKETYLATDSMDGWQDINESLYRNPADKATARIRAVMSLLPDYEYVNGEYTQKTNLLGMPVFTSDAYVSLLSLTSTLQDNDLESKLKAVRDELATIKASKEVYAYKYFYKDVHDMLTNTKGKNPVMSDKETYQFNVAMNNDALLMRGIGLSSKGRLFELNFNFSHYFTKFTSKLSSTLSNISSNEELSTFIHDILNPVNNRDLSVSSNEAYVFSSMVKLTQADIQNARLGQLASVIVNVQAGLDNPKKLRGLEGKKGLNSAEMEVLIEAYKPVVDEVVSRLTSIFSTLLPGLDESFAPVLRSKLLKGEFIPRLSFTGNNTGKDVSIAMAVKKLTFDLRSATAPLAKSEKEKGRQTAKVLSNESKSLLGDLIKNFKSFMASTVSRVGSKLLGTFNDKIFLYQMFKDLNSPDKSLLQQFKKDRYAKTSIILDMKLNPEKYSRIVGADEVFSEPIRAGIKPTYMSKEDKQDTPLQHTMFGLLNYMQSKELGFEEVARNSVQFTKGKVNRTINVGTAKLTTEVHADKDAPFAILGLDFQTGTFDLEGRHVMSKEAIELYVDEIVLPEINRMIAGRDEEGADYFYNTLALNTYTNIEMIANVDQTIQLESLYDLSSVSNSLDKQRLTSIRQFAENAIREQVSTASTMYINKLMHLDVIKASKKGYIWSDDFKDIEALKNITTSDPNVLIGSSDRVEGSIGSITFDKAFVSLWSQVIEQKKIADKVGLNSEEAFEIAEEMSPDLVYLAQSEKIAAFLLGDTSIENTLDILSKLGLKVPTDKAKSMDSILAYIKDDFSIMSDRVQLNTNAELLSEEAFYMVNAPIFEGSSTKQEIETETKSTKKSKKGDFIDMQRLLGLVMDKEYSTNISNMAMQQLISGDPYFAFKGPARENANKLKSDPKYNYTADVMSTIDNRVKRANKSVTPGRFADGKGKTKVIRILDPKSYSTIYNGENGYGNTGEMDAIDAISYTSIRGRLEHRVAKGELSQEEAAEAEKFLKGDLTEKQIGREKATNYAMKVDKPRIVSAEFLGDKTAPLYVKTGETGLHDNNVSENPNNFRRKVLDIINQLEEEGYSVRVMPGTAMKLNPGLVPFDVVNAKRGPDGRFDSAALEAASKDVSYKYYATQVRTDYKEGKEVKNSGQMENLAMNEVTPEMSIDLYGKKVKAQAAWKDVIDKLAAVRLKVAKTLYLGDEAMDEYRGLADNVLLAAIFGKEVADSSYLQKDFDDADSVLISDKALSDMLIRTLKNLGDDDLTKSNPLILDWLEVDENGTFKHNLTRSPFIQKYADIMKKAVEKKTMAAKRKGTQLALEPSYGWDLSEAGYKGGNGVILFDNAEIDTTTGELMPQRVNSDGNKVAQILVPWDVVTENEGRVSIDDFLKTDIVEKIIDGKKKKVEVTTIDTSKLPKEIMEAIGFRTPTQDYSSMSYVEVVGFLPSGTQNTVVAPQEFISTMGSDFDIDKLFMYQLYLNKKEENGVTTLEVIGQDDEKENSLYYLQALENRKTRILQGILNDSDIIKNHISRNLDGEKYLDNIANKIERAIVRDSALEGKTSPLSVVFNEERRDNAAGAGTSIGVFALLSRVSAMLNRKPMPLMAKSEEGLKEITVELGSMKVKEFGAKRNFKVFKEGVGIDKDYDNPKNGISAFLSASVDNETLQILHRLGINENTYDIMSSLLLTRFKPKTIVAIANMPNFTGEITHKKLKSELLKYTRTKTNKAVKESELTPDLFTLMKVQEPTVDKDGLVLDDGRVDESKMGDKLIDMNFKLRKFLGILDPNLANYDSIEELSSTEALDIIRLMEFVNKINSSYNTVITPFRWAFNMDSKGIARNFSKLFRQKKLVNNSMYAPVVKILRSLPEIDSYLNVFNLHVQKIDGIFKKDIHVRRVFDILGDTGLDVNGTYEVTQFVKAKAYQSYRPNFSSLTGRIISLRVSGDSQARDYYNSNEFLKRLVIGKKDLTFNRDDAVTAGDIYADLEALNVDQTLGGVHLRTLYDDLVLQGITGKVTSYGNTYTSYIHPRHQTNLGDKPVNVDHERLAAAIAFNVINTVPSRSNKSKDSILWRENNSIVYIDSKGNKEYFSEKDKETFFYIDSQEDLRTSLITPKVSGENLSEGEFELDYEKTAERVFSSPSLQPLKSLFKTIFKNNNIKHIFSTSSSFNVRANEMRISGRNLTAVRRAIIHEGTHVALQGVVEAYLNNNLSAVFGNGENAEGNVIKDEIARIFEGLEESRGKIIDNVIDKAKESKNIKAEDDIFNENISMDKFISAILANDANALNMEELTGGLSEEVLKYLAETSHLEADPSVDGSIANVEALDALMSKDAEQKANTLLSDMPGYKQRIGFLNILSKGMYSQSNTEGMYKYMKVNGYMSLVFKTQKGWKLLMYTEASREKFYDTIREELDLNIAQAKKDGIKDAFAAGLIATANQTIPEVSTFELDKTKTMQQYLYGLTNLNEFIAQAYAYGSNSVPSTINLKGYSAESNYSSVVDINLDNVANTLYNRIFNMLKKIVNILIGKDKTNTIFKDVLYATTLVNRSNFVSTNDTMQNIDTMDSYFTEVSQELIENCN